MDDTSKGNEQLSQEEDQTAQEDISIFIRYRAQMCMTLFGEIFPGRLIFK